MRAVVPKVVKYATNITEQVQLLDKLREMINTNFGEIDAAIQCSVKCSAPGRR